MTKTVPLPECVRAARPWADWALCLALMLVAAGYRLDLLATL